MHNHVEINSHLTDDAPATGQVMEVDRGKEDGLKVQSDKSVKEPSEPFLLVGSGSQAHLEP